MREIKLDTGLETFNINGKCELVFNPTDMNFAERLFNVFDELDAKQSEYKNRIDGTADSRAFFEVSRKLDEEMRAIVDNALEADVCDSVFGSLNLYAMSDGLPLWANLLLTLIDEIDSSITRERKLTDARLNKYTAKYQKKAVKK